MDVYLIQHGLAVSEEQDPQRPLSDEGRAVTNAIAEYIAARAARLIDPPILEVRHSGKLRAEQTAEIFAHALGSNVPLNTIKNMKPKDDPSACYKELIVNRDRAGAIILVGHLPHLARLAGLMLTGDAADSPIQFANAAVLKLQPTESRWAVAWYLTRGCIPE